MKTCSKCNIYKQLTEFHKSGGEKYLAYCKVCRSAARKKETALYRLKHADDIKLNKLINGKMYNKNSKKYKQKWAQDNSEHVSNMRRIYKKKNRETVNAYNRMRAAKKRGNYCELISKNTLKDIKQIFNNSCAYCGTHENTTKLVWDHVYPISKGGSHTIENLVPSCESCNLRKHAKLPLHWFAILGWIKNVFD